MNEDGSFTIIEKPDSGQMFADPYLRVFPRKVTLAPREPQVLALQCRRRSDMVPGEYRSHLYFRSEKNNNPLGSDKTQDDTTVLKVQLTPIFGISIPIIIRSGEVVAKASLSELKLDLQQDTIPYLKLTLNRTGNASIYGNVTIDYIPVKGKPYEIGALNGVGVYTNVGKRFISIKLNKTPGMTLKNGKLKVRYTSPDDSKYVIYTETEMELK